VRAEFCANFRAGALSISCAGAGAVLWCDSVNQAFTRRWGAHNLRPGFLCRIVFAWRELADTIRSEPGECLPK
jgi:hypothetical protein